MVHLLANIGGEEIGADTRPLRPRVERLIGDIATSWSLLFAADARVLDQPAAQWPSAFGPRPPHAAFAWLESDGDSPLGVPWLVTSEAVQRLVDSGARVDGPSAEVVRLVHDKAMATRAAAALGLVPSCIAPLIEVLEPDALTTRRGVETIIERIASWPEWTRRRALLKPRLGASGRGHVAVDLAGDVPRPKVFHRMARRGGAILEPLLDRVDDMSAQLFVASDGTVELLGTTVQLFTGRGRYVGNRGVISAAGVDASHPQQEAVAAGAIAIATAAAERGFSGPCGVDAFTFVGPNGQSILRPIVELNARFTTATVILGLLRRAREAGVADVGDTWQFWWRGAPSTETLARHTRAIRLSERVDGPLLTLDALLGDARQQSE